MENTLKPGKLINLQILLDAVHLYVLNVNLSPLNKHRDVYMDLAVNRYSFP